MVKDTARDNRQNHLGWLIRKKRRCPQRMMSIGRIVTFFTPTGRAGLLDDSGQRGSIWPARGSACWRPTGIHAPGLHRYFAPFLLDPLMAETRGLIDFISDYAVEVAAAREAERPDRKVHDIRCRYAVSLEWQFPEDGGIDLVGAGRGGPSYSVAVNAFSWSQFYERMGGARFLETVRRQPHAANTITCSSTRSPEPAPSPGPA